MYIKRLGEFLYILYKNKFFIKVIDRIFSNFLPVYITCYLFKLPIYPQNPQNEKEQTQ